MSRGNCNGHSRRRSRRVESPGVSNPAGAPAHHIVRFSKHDDDLIQAFADFVADGMRMGERVMLVVTQDHWTAIEDVLRKKRVRIENALRHREVVMVDAEETIERMTVNDVIDINRFDALLSPVLATLTPPVRLCGELVSLFAKRGLFDVAMEIEKLGHRVAREYGINVLCTYDLSSL